MASSRHAAEARPGSPAGPTEGLDDLAFVERVFARTLGRAVDPQALHDLLDQLGAGLSRVDALAVLEQSEEALRRAARRDPERVVTVEALLRVDGDARFAALAWRLLSGSEADPAWLAIAETALRSGADRLDWLRALRRETAGRHAASGLADVHALDLEPSQLAQPSLALPALLALPDEGFVYAAYRQLLHRAPDGLGRAGYLRRLREGMPRIDLLLDLAGSEEGRREAGRIDDWTPRFARSRRLVDAVRRAARAVGLPGSQRPPIARNSP